MPRLVILPTEVEGEGYGCTERLYDNKNDSQQQEERSSNQGKRWEMRCGSFHCAMQCWQSPPDPVSCTADQIPNSLLRESSSELVSVGSEPSGTSILSTQSHSSSGVNLEPVYDQNHQLLPQEEMALLQNCQDPPRKLKPGDHWCDQVTSFWGKVLKWLKKVFKTEEGASRRTVEQRPELVMRAPG